MKVISEDENAPTPDLAPRKRRSSRDAQGKDGQARKDWQGKDARDAKDGEHRGKRRERGQSDGEGDQKGQTGPAQGSDRSGGEAKSQP